MVPLHPMATAGTRRSFGVGNVLSRAFPIWARNFIPFTILSTLVYSPLLLYALVALNGGNEARRWYPWVSAGLGHLLAIIVTGVLVYGVFQQVRGQPAGLVDCVRVGLKRLLPVVGVGIVVGILWAFGTLLLIVPGIIVQCMYWLAVPVAVVEGSGVVASMKRSARLTSGEKGTIFAILLLLGIFQIAVATVLRIALGVGFGPEMTPIQTWATLVLAIPFGALTAVANAVAYHDLRVAKEGVGIEDLVRVFE